MWDSIRVTKRKINDLYHWFFSRPRSFGKARASGQELWSDGKVRLQIKNKTLLLVEISQGEYFISNDTHWCLSSDLFLRIPLLGWLVSSSMFNNFSPTTLWLWPSLPRIVILFSGSGITRGITGGDSGRRFRKAWLVRELQNIEPEYPELCTPNELLTYAAEPFGCFSK